MAPTQQAHTYESAGDNAPRADKKSHVSKAVAREMNRLKTQEGQMIKALSKMNFNEKRQYDLTNKQKKRLRRRENAAVYAPDPDKIALKEEKAAQRAQDPERIARMEAHNQKTAENKARLQAKRARNIKESRQHGAGRSLMDKIKVETSDALEHASALQSHGAENEYISRGPAIRIRGQRAAHQVNTELQDLATVHSMPEETGTDAFLDRADSLIHQTLASVNSVLSPADRKNLEEALSLVRTVQLLSSKDHRPLQNSTSYTGQFDRVLRGPNPDEYLTHDRRSASAGVPIKQENTSDGDAFAQQRDSRSDGHLRGGFSDGFNLSQSGIPERDAMVE
ncbi:hypothetical protein M436DRAFT_77514 [Aureobasidium namibiae CBS 147.97]|uniref:Uncharacterized protein n=1 Tax=Aureobasidium namibiae CBS 147.97 TaxID=1043004 RepID=A0A074WWR1_9PEZI|nr:uncharacterized protein M436DRAFT_77514 [Aureobasidium namibiae CBS 147.97]KEQ77640.1 hypothetical protein M436DRAFT_77514 [Aureobasidium namibiae CBS 147.97]